MKTMLGALPYLIGAGLAVPALVSTTPSVAQGYGQPYAPPPLAADRNQASYATQDLPLYQPSIWEGLYLGAHLGGDFGRLHVAGASDDGFDMSGVTGGLHLGYNWQRQNFVAGLEFAADGKSTEGGRDGTALVSVNGGPATAMPVRYDGGPEWITSMRLRLGFAMGNTLLFATGGYALADMNLSAKLPVATLSTSETMHGYVFGGGIELKLMPNMSARIEALHYEFSDKTFSDGVNSARADADLTTVRAGLTFHFN